MIKKSTYLGVFCLFSILSQLWAADLERGTQLRAYAQQYLQTYQSAEHITDLAITLRNTRTQQATSIHVAQSTAQPPLIFPVSGLFQVGSITKSFIAALILKLAADPRYHLQLNQPIGLYLPEYKNWRAITIQQLLQMTSGIPDFATDADNLKRYSTQPYRNFSALLWLQTMAKRPLQFKPGTRFSYSNTNYLVLSQIIEKVTHQPVAKALEENILAPLHLFHTYYNPGMLPTLPSISMVPGYQAQQHLLQFIPLGTEISHYNISYLGAAGCMYATTEDISRWIADLFSPGKLLTATQIQTLTRLISEKTAKPLRTLSAQDPAGYGLGIRKAHDTQLNTDFYLYEGVTFGYRFLYLYFPKQHLIITLAVNSNAMTKPDHLLQLAKKLFQRFSH